MLVLFHSSSYSHSNSSSDFGFSCGGGGKQTEYENRCAEYEDEDELNIPGLLTGYNRGRVSAFQCAAAPCPLAFAAEHGYNYRRYGKKVRDPVTGAKCREWHGEVWFE